MVFQPKYSEEQRRAATAEVIRRRARDSRDRSVFRETAEKYEVGEQSLRLWVKDAISTAANGGGAADARGADDELGVEESFHLLREEVARLTEENDTLRKAFILMSAEWTGVKGVVGADDDAPRLPGE